MTEITLFHFENKPARTATVRGEVVWIAKDVAENLEYVWSGSRTIKHIPAEWRGVTSVPTPSGLQEMAYLTEQGLFFFLGRSDKPKAFPFQKWVADVVMPSIRKTGSYSTQPLPFAVPKSFSDALRLAADQAELIEEMKPKVAAHAIITEAASDLGVRDAGRELKLGQGWVANTILARKWACRQGGALRPAHYGLEMGYVRLCATPYTCRITGETKVRDDIKITRKGIDRLAQIIAQNKAKNTKEMEAA